MIPHNELRNGCTIKDPHGEGVLTLKEFTCTGDKVVINNKELPTEKLEGIPIDDDILEKCGFDLEYGLADPDYDLYKKGEVALNRDYKLAFKCSDQMCTLGIPLQYLHQLQNLYLDLCREELTYNP